MTDEKTTGRNETDDPFELVCIWLESALKCKSFVWSPDQADAAADSLRMARENLKVHGNATNEALDALRYSILRDYMEPRILYDKLLRSGKYPGAWIDLFADQTIRQKIDELCDGQLNRVAQKEHESLAIEVHQS